MSVVAAYLYREGKRVSAIPIAETIDHKPTGSEFYWIGLVEPTAAELVALQANFGLHPLAVEDAQKAHQLPKVDVYGDQLYVVARTVFFDAGSIAYGETSVFVGPHHVISVRHGSVRAHTELRAQLESSPSLLKHGVDYVLHAILDFIVDGYPPVIDDVEETVHAMEHQALEHFLDRDDIRRLSSLRRQLTRLQRIMDQTSDLCLKLAGVELPHIDAEVRPYFRNVHDHVQRVALRIANLHEVLSSVFEISLLLEQQHQGDITRQLAAWAAILAVPTAIAGIYGMNFEHMPELGSPYGYYVVLAAITAICVFLYVRFKRSGWL